MRKWVVQDGDEADSELAVIEASAEARTISLHIPSPDPVVMTPERVHEIRDVLGLAIGVARSGDTNHEEAGSDHA